MTIGEDVVLLKCGDCVADARLQGLGLKETDFIELATATADLNCEYVAIMLNATNV